MFFVGQRRFAAQSMPCYHQVNDLLLGTNRVGKTVAGTRARGLI